MQTRMPLVGEIVLFTSNPGDEVAKSNYNKDEIAAIVTRVWSETCVNLKIVPDCGPMQDRTSVVHFTSNPAGYHFRFRDEKKNFPIETSQSEDSKDASSFLKDNETKRPWNRVDLMSPAEKLITDALWEVEKIGADIRLTEAVNLLDRARGLVYDFLEGDQPKK